MILYIHGQNKNESWFIMLEKLKEYSKIKEGSGSLSTHYFYNAKTKHLLHIITDDKEYGYREGLTSQEFTWEELDLIEKTPINKEALKIYNFDNNIIMEGQLVEVVKGRKMPIGYKGIIKKIYPYKDRYGRVQIYTAYFEDGQKTNIDNLKILK